MSETAVEDKKVNITIPCIVKSTEQNQNPLLIFWITRVFQIGEKIYTTLDMLSILNKCKDYVLKNLDIISAISKFPKENLKAFCKELNSEFLNNREQFLNLLNCKIEMPKNKRIFGEAKDDISLFPNEKLFQDEDGRVGVGFPTIYKFVMQGKEGELEFSKETIDAYKNLPDKVNFYEYEISIKNLSAEELKSWEADKIINNIDYLSNKQLLELNAKRMEYLSYLQNESDNFNDDIKQKVFARFIKSFTAKEFIDWNNYINIESFSNLNIDIITGLVEHLVNNENLSVDFVKKIFYSLHGLLKNQADIHLAEVGAFDGDPKLWKIFNENLFAKMVQYQDYIDFKEIFIFSTPSDSHAVSQVKQNVNRIGDSVTKKFLEFLYKGKEHKNFDNLLRNEYFSKLIFQVLYIPLNEILNFYLPWSESDRLAEFPSKLVNNLIKSIDSLELQQKFLAYKILIIKVNVNYKLINNLPIKTICVNLNQIKSGALTKLQKERFEKLIDYFVKNGTIGFGGFRKILVGFYDKANNIEPNKIFDLMMCLKINDNSEKASNINTLKQYFNDLFSKEKVNSTWRSELFQYIFSQKCEMNDLVLDILPQIVNYFTVEQIYGNLEKIQKHGLIDKNFNKCNELQEFIYDKEEIEKITIWQEILKNNIMLIINSNNYKEILHLIKNSDTEFLKNIAQNIEPDKLFKFNDFVNIAYKENKNILQEMLKFNPALVNDINDNEIFINLMMKDEQIDGEWLEIVSSKIGRIKFSQLVRWSITQNNLPTHVELIFSQFAEKNLSNDNDYWYNFDFDSRIIVLNAYFKHINNEIPQDIIKKLLLSEKYLPETINLLQGNNTDKICFIGILKTAVLSEFEKFPIQSMLQLSMKDEYKEKFISILSDGIFVNLLQPEILSSYKKQINGMLENSTFKEKLTTYINKVNNNKNLLDLCNYLHTNKYGNIIDLITRDNFLTFAKYLNQNGKLKQLNVIANCFKKHFDYLSDDILMNAFKEALFSIVRAVSKEKFDHIISKLKKELPNDKIKSLSNAREIKKNDNENDVKNENDDNEKSDIDKNDSDFDDKLKTTDDEEQESSHKKRNVMLISSGTLVELLAFTFLMLALFSPLSFVIGASLAGGLFTFGIILFTVFGVKFSKENNKSNEDTTNSEDDGRRSLNERIPEKQEEQPEQEFNNSLAKQ